MRKSFLLDVRYGDCRNLPAALTHTQDGLLAYWSSPTAMLLSRMLILFFPSDISFINFYLTTHPCKLQIGNLT